MTPLTTPVTAETIQAALSAVENLAADLLQEGMAEESPLVSSLFAAVRALYEAQAQVEYLAA